MGDSIGEASNMPLMPKSIDKFSPAHKLKAWFTDDNYQNIKRIALGLFLAGAVAALLFIPGLQVIGVGAAVALMSKSFFAFTHVPLLFEALSIAGVVLIPFM